MLHGRISRERDIILANEEKSEQRSRDLLGHTPNTFMIVTYALTLVAAFGAVTQLWNRDFERVIMLYSIKQLLYGLGVLIFVTIFSHFTTLVRFVFRLCTGYSKIAESIFYFIILFVLFSAPIVVVSHFYCVSFWTIDQLATASGTTHPSLDISFQYGDKCIAVMSFISAFANWCASLLNFFGDSILDFIRALPRSFFIFFSFNNVRFWLFFFICIFL
jgi:hypothetical protein